MRPKLTLTRPKEPKLKTAQRVRAVRIKSSAELEEEMLARVPKFKALPLNKKIFESKRDLRLHCQFKPHITAPQEFHFATDDRLGPPPSTMMFGSFDKLSLHSKSSHHGQEFIPKVTKPNPFHLRTEERGLQKEKMFTLTILQKRLEEYKARIPKMSPKPQPKQSTESEVFQFYGLIRHEEEMQKSMKERERTEREEAERTIFRAQPIMKKDPFPLPERKRRPLTDVQEFILQVDHRAVERSEFDKKKLLQVHS